MQHWISLVIGVYQLLEKRVTIFKLKKSKILLDMFGRDIGKLYGDRMYVPNIHQTTKHLADYVERWGPLWANSGFPFESFIGFLARFLHGTNDIAQELFENIRIYQGFLALENEIIGPKLVEDLESSFVELGLPVELPNELDQKEK
ncbi:hypothetical protein QAD02_000753 [Eretmocerus hayati]|uniref:Uncharacterized protein n=1 Tax=Eretmocerus hayati TaxID=131215 RepID=A0ACC2NEJ0_9HYME|nr:hypothetical protein QAD02_000753 [Eretmocerus hayati]